MDPDQRIAEHPVPSQETEDPVPTPALPPIPPSRPKPPKPEGHTEAAVDIPRDAALGPADIIPDLDTLNIPAPATASDASIENTDPDPDSIARPSALGYTEPGTRAEGKKSERDSRKDSAIPVPSTVQSAPGTVSVPVMEEPETARTKATGPGSGKKKKVSIALPRSSSQDSRIVNPGQSLSNEEVSSLPASRSSGARGKKGEYLTTDELPFFTGSEAFIRSVSPDATSLRFAKTRVPDPRAVPKRPLLKRRPTPHTSSARPVVVKKQVVKKRKARPIAFSPRASSASLDIPFNRRLSSYGSKQVDGSTEYVPPEREVSPLPSTIPMPKGKSQTPRKYIATPRKRQMYVAPRQLSDSETTPVPTKSRQDHANIANPENQSTPLGSASPEALEMPDQDRLRKGAMSAASESPTKPKDSPKRPEPNLEAIPPAPPGKKPKNHHALTRPFDVGSTPTTPLAASPESISQALTFNQPIRQRVSSARLSSVQEHSSGPSAEVAYASQISRRNSAIEGDKALAEHRQRVARYKDAITLGKSMGSREAERMDMTLHAEGIATGDFLPRQRPKRRASIAGNENVHPADRRPGMARAFANPSTPTKQLQKPVMRPSLPAQISSLATPPNLQTITKRTPSEERIYQLLSLGRSSLTPPSVSPETGSSVSGRSSTGRASSKFGSFSGLASLFREQSVAVRSLRDPKAFRPRLPIPAFEDAPESTSVS